MNGESAQATKEEEVEKRGPKISDIKKSLYERIREQSRVPGEAAGARGVERVISPERFKESRNCITKRLSEAENSKIVSAKEVERTRQSKWRTSRGPVERASVDMSRASMDMSRASVELPRASADMSRASADMSRASMDMSRASVELPRASVELPRASADMSRASADMSRASMDMLRGSMDMLRGSMDMLRASIELPRASADMSRASVDVLRASAELPRASVNLKRGSAELPRRSAELPRVSVDLSASADSSRERVQVRRERAAERESAEVVEGDGEADKVAVGDGESADLADRRSSSGGVRVYSSSLSTSSAAKVSQMSPEAVLLYAELSKMPTPSTSKPLPQTPSDPPQRRERVVPSGQRTSWGSVGSAGPDVAEHAKAPKIILPLPPTLAKGAKGSEEATATEHSKKSKVAPSFPPLPVLPKSATRDAENGGAGDSKTPIRSSPVSARSGTKSFEEAMELANEQHRLASPSFPSPLSSVRKSSSRPSLWSSAVKLVGFSAPERYEALEPPSSKQDDAKSARQRKFVVDELINTEQSYIKSLTILVDYFLSPIEKLEADCMHSYNGELMLTVEERSILFSNIKRLMLINLRFFSSLQRAYKEWDTHESIGHVFIKYFIPELDAYDHYAVNYSACLTLFYELMKKPSIKKVLESLWEKSKYSINEFSGFIITPIQRLPRYMLLLQALLKHTPPTHRDYNDLTTALNTLVRTIEVINSRVENIDGLNQYIMLQRRIIFDYKSELSTIMKSTRRFIKELSLEIFVNDVKHDANHVVLFNDSLGIFIKKRKNYIFQGLIHFKNADVVKIDCFHSLTMFSIFVACKLLNPECLIQLIFPDMETRDRWFEDMCEYDQKIRVGQDAFVNFTYYPLPSKPKTVNFDQGILVQDGQESPSSREDVILSKTPVRQENITSQPRIHQEKIKKKKKK
ncbi:uncharacterized protein LOC126311187 [Schistocerca gregaria]|uniref:uncharacterized protein LOC126311187 n=1 Tax=Schistocerca gregaria TaxID=7010 RepID=UPI00211DA48A|nr:uncharacterized protein LOC126311187 [Schistocerca gregaria]